MEANEAPEKIYLQENTTSDCYEEWWPEWFEARARDSDIEYTRTDALIEKACEWIDFFLRDLYIFNSNDMQGVIEEFEKYMKGE